MKIEYDNYSGFSQFDDVSSLPVFILEIGFDAVAFYDKHKLDIVNLMYNGVTKAIDNDFLEIPICRLHFLDGRRATLSISRDNFDNILNKCLVTFEELEEYEKCNEIVKLLKIK